MKFIDRAQIESLTVNRTNGVPTTSFYLDTDKSRLTKKEITVSVKQLISEGRARLEAANPGRENRETLAADLERVEGFCGKNLASFHHAGLALFSCARTGFWEAIELPHGPRNRIVLDQNFYIRPLVGILDRYLRILALLIDRKEARWYRIYMGEIAPLESLASDVPRRVKVGGFQGSDSRRMERHFDARLLEHFKKAVHMTLDMMRKNGFDGLLLGCEDEAWPVLEPALHPYIKECLIGRLKSKPDDPPDKIRREAEGIEDLLKSEKETETVQRLIAELESGGLACSGIKETLERLNRFEIQTLVVTHNFSKEGRICPSCRSLFVDVGDCPFCLKPTLPVFDVVDEAIEFALRHGETVRQVSQATRLDRYGKIGAFLKFKSEVPPSRT